MIYLLMCLVALELRPVERIGDVTDLVATEGRRRARLYRRRISYQDKREVVTKAAV